MRFGINLGSIEEMDLKEKRRRNIGSEGMWRKAGELVYIDEVRLCKSNGHARVMRSA